MDLAEVQLNTESLLRKLTASGHGVPSDFTHADAKHLNIDVEDIKLSEKLRADIARLEKILQEPPSGTHVHNADGSAAFVLLPKMRGDYSKPKNVEDLAWEPDVEAKMFIQKKDKQWKSRVLSYHNTVVRQQDNKNSGPWKSVQIFFIQQDIQPPLDRSTGFHIESDIAGYSFSMYASSNIYRCRTDTLESCERWVDFVSGDLRKNFSDREWQEKQAAAKELSVFVRQFFDLELRKYTHLMFRMVNAGLMDSRLDPKVRSLSGVMLKIRDGDAKWEEMYFVLTDTTLLAFKSSRAKEPKDVIVTKYSSFSVDEAYLKERIYVWVVRSPLATYHLRVKHAVSLAEWLHACERTIRTPGSAHASSTDLLQRIHKLQTDISSLEKVLLFPGAFNALLTFIKDAGHQSQLQLWQEIQTYLRQSHEKPEAMNTTGRQILKDSIVERIRHMQPGSADGKDGHKDAFDNFGSEFDFPSTVEELKRFETAQESLHSKEIKVVEAKVENLGELRKLQHEVATQLHNQYYAEFIKSEQFKPIADAIRRITKEQNVGIEKEGDNASPSQRAGETRHEPSPSVDYGDPTNVRRSSVAAAAADEKAHLNAKPEDLKIKFEVMYKKHKRPEKGASKGKEKEGDKDKDKEKDKPKDDKPVPGEKIYYKYFKLAPHKHSVTIGRASNNDIYIPDSGVSRMHARIEIKHGEMTFIDLGSSYGSLVNGHKSVRVHLHPGDVIKIGISTTITLVPLDAAEKKGANDDKCVIC